ncbi:ADP-ribosylation factor family-domain-containing protein [Favolaschia claudopus]|uniref:ADP-ribosylation factor family-domain-containing protein n=1 Tax=Favolaschia claudopus TaxID=2862362 RepID=A0AAW0BFE7_9AGAR
MGSVISTAKGAASALLGSPKNFTLMMVGLDDAGKTSLLSRLKRREPKGTALPPTIPTIGFNIESISYGQHTIEIWDSGGSESIRPCARCYYWHAQAFAFVVDAAAPARFAEAKDDLERVWLGTENEFPFLVIANKMDLAGAVDLCVIEEALGIQRLARSGRAIALKVQIIYHGGSKPFSSNELQGVSALNGHGFDEVLEWLVQNLSYSVIARLSQGG